jgi:hypothetical protein
LQKFPQNSSIVKEMLILGLIMGVLTAVRQAIGMMQMFLHIDAVMKNPWAAHLVLVAKNVQSPHLPNHATPIIWPTSK